MSFTALLFVSLIVVDVAAYIFTTLQLNKIKRFESDLYRDISEVYREIDELERKYKEMHLNIIDEEESK